MATLILAFPGRNGHEYHKINRPVVRVGRALDNDIILSDPTVSPYHFVIRRNEADEHELHSLADENGIRINQRRISEPVKINHLPLDFDAGRTRIRLMESSQPVAPTRLISCRDGGACLFGHWGWSLFLFTALMLLSAVDNYLSTPLLISWKSYGQDQAIFVLFTLGLWVGLLIVNRFTSQRWDYPSSLSFVSLMLTIALLLELLVPFLDYFFTSPLPGFTVNLAWSVVLVPLLIGWFLVRLQHGNFASSVLFIIVLLSPGAYFQVRQLATHYGFFDMFSKKAFYSHSLYPWGKQIKGTLSIDDFAETAMPSVRPEYSK